MLHEASLDGGVGFCSAALPDLLPLRFHGPLVVALDSSVLIDFQEHGAQLINNDLPDAIEAHYRDELDALGAIVDLWLIRDIRFIVTPASLNDTKRNGFRADRVEAVEALAKCLAFQQGDWVSPPPSDLYLAPQGQELGLPDGPDRELVLEAQSVGAHVFLTRDGRVLKRASLVGPRLSVLSPTGLLARLTSAGVWHFGGGTCGEATCPYAGPWLAPDTGRHAALLAIFGEQD